VSKKYAEMTNTELVAEQERICADPANRAPEGELNLYTKAAQKKLRLIAEWITHNLAEKRKAAGNPVPCDGFSGRKQKRRR
jgi:hypothetical protein